MRIAIVYDCLYPNTVGGAERWLRALVEDLGQDHEITYVTRRQWQRGEEPEIEGVRCVAVSRGGTLYRDDGSRRLGPPALFAVGVFFHFLRHRRDYDVVDCVSYPYLPLIALRAALVGRRRTKVFCTWLECLTPEYFRTYGGRLSGRVFAWIQSLCVQLSPSAFAISELVADRLYEAGFEGEMHRLTGFWIDGRERPPADPGAGRAVEPAGDGPLVLFAGRHVPDKRVAVLPEALAIARQREPGLRAVIVGDGPERVRVVEQLETLGLTGSVTAPGFVSRAALDELYGDADCVVSPSIRDGYGIAVVEAAGAGIPAVVCRHPDNAATELVEEGVNGAVAISAEAADLADAIVRAVAGGEELKASTKAWFADNRQRLTMTASIQTVREVYGAVAGELTVAAPRIA
jgi:glycosyltransferase involved in cell wall biosynthesis